MKKVISLLLVLACVLSLCACGEKTPVSSSSKGLLKTKTEYHFIHYPDNAQFSETEINSVTTTIYEYDENYQLLSSCTDNNTSSRMGYTETYTYKDDKTLSGEAEGYYSSDSDTTFKKTTEYDENGNITYERKEYTDGFQKGSSYDSTYKYTYGKNGEILTKKSYNDGKLTETSSYEYEYNEKGLPAKSTETVQQGDNETVWINTYTYDINGNLILETRDVADIPGQRTSLWSSSQTVYTYI
jgi:hypothetical protein